MQNIKLPEDIKPQTNEKQTVPNNSRINRFISQLYKILQVY